MKKFIWLLPLIALLLIAGSEPIDPIRLTIINKSGMGIAIQLKAVPKVCCNKNETIQGDFYYLPVLEGDKQWPTSKVFIIERDTYQMQLFYLETWDPVYGFKCTTPAPNVLMAKNNLRVVVLPCDEIPGPGQAVGERTMWKYLPFPIGAYAGVLNNYWLRCYVIFSNKYWVTRLIY